MNYPIHGTLALIPVIILIFSIQPVNSESKRVCYLLLEDPNLFINPDHLKWNLCTHLIFSFAYLDNWNVKVNKIMDQYIQQMMQRNHSEIQYLVSITTFNMTFVESEPKINKFLDSVISLMGHYKLDGLDLDWEFPFNQKDQFTRLLRLTRLRFNKKISHRGKPYLLTVALAPVIYIVEMSYNVRAIGHLVDFVNLMTYDFHSPNTFPYTNFNSPLYANRLDKLYFKYFNINFAVNYMWQLGLPKDKIIVGIPFYGYKYYLANKQFHGLYAMSNGTEEPVKFNEICHGFLNDTKTIREFDRDSKVPYAYKNYEWITFDDWESITIKAQWIIDQRLGGSMTFALNYDDHQAKCSMNRFPLQTILYDILN